MNLWIVHVLLIFVYAKASKHLSLSSGRFCQGPPGLSRAWKWMHLASGPRWSMLKYLIVMALFRSYPKALYGHGQGSSFVSNNGLIHMSNHPSSFLIFWPPHQVSPDPINDGFPLVMWLTKRSSEDEGRCRHCHFLIHMCVMASILSKLLWIISIHARNPCLCRKLFKAWSPFAEAKRAYVIPSPPLQD